MSKCHFDNIESYNRERNIPLKFEPKMIESSAMTEDHENLNVSIQELTVEELSSGDSSIFSDDIFYIDGFSSDVRIYCESSF